MSISELDLKKLWGLSAGMCSKPGCEESCIPYLDKNTPLILGEMAHIIAESPDGPRGVLEGGTNNYDNLILLCPTHHRLVDKSPEGYFSVEELHRWKTMHEESIRLRLNETKLLSPAEVAVKVLFLLSKNKAIWREIGPESEEAKQNPLSNSAFYWNLRKLDTIVPNNEKILSLITANGNLFMFDDYDSFAQFEIHATGFKQNCYVRTEGVPRFPLCFEEVMKKYAM